jgi:hypothetical protein
MYDIQAELAAFKDHKMSKHYLWPISYRTPFYNADIGFGQPNGRRNSDADEFMTWVQPSLRFKGKAHDLIRLGHRGWYVDSALDDVVYGVVYQLPAKHGEERYLAGCVYSYDTECVSLDVTQVYDSERDAAYASEELARIAAEHSCEEDMKYQHAQVKEKAREHRSVLRARMRSIVAALRWKRRMARTSPPVYIPDIFNTLAEEELRRSIAERAELYKIWKYGPEDS